MDWTTTTMALAVIAGIGAATLGGYLLARAMNLGDLSERVALVVFLVAVTGWMLSKYELRRGIDLIGGVVMVYEVDEAKTKRLVTNPSGEQVETKIEYQLQELVNQLKRRLDPGGVRELVVRQFGDRQVEVIVPKVESEDELERIKTVITQAGILEFRIVASRRFNGPTIALAESNNDVRIKEVLDPADGDKKVAKWIKVARDEPIPGVKALPPFKFDFTSPDYAIRNGRTGERVPLDAPEVVAAMSIDKEARRMEALSAALAKLNCTDVEILVMFDNYNVHGSHVQSVSSGINDDLSPMINFNMTFEGAILFGQLTGENTPVNGEHHLLGIILDEQLLTAPRLLSRISEHGQITGRFTKKEVETLVQILQFGRLPAVLHKAPISQEEISALLGQDTIEKGTMAMGLSLAGIVLFMLFYYRPVAGLIASLTLALNLAFVIALMIFVGARLTLPGMAGLVLTVGMAVDSNVLIYERIREEFDHGSTFRMAIRNGFSRALGTIIDANVTTIITGIVLYLIGTDTIRGFAVTLVLGIITSMFTAVFCSRLAFDILDRKGWVSSLDFLHIFSAKNIDFVGVRNYAMIGSAALILLTFVVVGVRGRDMLDTDLLGGASVQLLFKDPVTPDKVRSIVTAQWPNASVTNMNIAGLTDRVYKIDTPLTGEEPYWKRVDLDHNPTPQEIWAGIEKDELVKGPSSESYPDGAEIAEAYFQFKLFKDQLSYNELGIAEVTEIAAGAPLAPPATPPTGVAPPVDVPPGTTPAPVDPTPVDPAPVAPAPETPVPPVTPAPPGEGEPKSGEPKSAEPAPTPPKTPEPGKQGSRGLQFPRTPATTFVGFADDPATPPEAADPAPAPTPPTAEVPAPVPESAPAPEAAPVVPTEPAAPMTPGATTPSEPKPPLVAGNSGARTTAKLAFGANQEPKVRESLAKIDAEAVRHRVERAAERLGYEQVEVEAVPIGTTATDSVVGTDWLVTVSLPKADTEKVLEVVRVGISERPIFPSSSRIGGLVAGNTQVLAIVAILVSCIGIVIYVWFRFHKVVYGVAAVVALVHDVVITVGAIGVSVWLTGLLGFLMIDDFKISLAVVAALLTIIGYSINDTIVIFDRIREVRGKIPTLTVEMANTSLNQTFSRTILTSTLTFLSTIVLYFFGGPSIHAFAFAICVGIIVGSYSSIYIATPLLLWFEEPETPISERKDSKKELSVK